MCRILKEGTIIQYESRKMVHIKGTVLESLPIEAFYIADIAIAQYGIFIILHGITHRLIVDEYTFPASPRNGFIVIIVCIRDDEIDLFRFRADCLERAVDG